MHISMTRLYEAAAKFGYTKPSEVARALNEAQQTLKNWESRGISKSGLLKAQAAFHVDAAWLEGGSPIRKENAALFQQGSAPVMANIGEKIPLKGRVPLISYVAAGNWSEAVDNFVAGDADEWVSTTIPVRRHTYALKVMGDSMEPKFPSGATIIIEPEDAAHNGSYVIARQGNGEATFKQLVYDGAQAFLKPLNPRYPIIQFSDETVICGVVKQMVMDV